MPKITLLVVSCGALLLTACPAGSDATPSDASTSSGASSTGETGPTDGGDVPTGASSSDTGDTPETGGADNQCDPWAQDCPGGTKCMAYAAADSDYFTGTRCTPVVDQPAASGDTCTVTDGWWTGIDTCDYGLACWNVDPATRTGACVEMCSGSADSPSCGDEADICVFWVPGISHVCLEGCDPLTSDCPGTQLCVPNYANLEQGFVCALDYSGDEGQEFDPCAASNVCDKGLLCWDATKASECDATSPGCCLSMCDLEDPQCNGAGAVCEPFYANDDGPPTLANLGVCVLPG